MVVQIIYMQGKWKGVYLKPVRQKEAYEPSQEELIEYAQSIGIVMPQDKELLYIAFQGFQSNLPPNWQACRTPDDQLVYRNFKTGQITDQDPLQAIYVQKVRQAQFDRMESNQEKEIQLDINEDQQEETVVQEDLSEILEDENQLGNQSEVYERGRYHVEPKKDMLRLPITKSVTKQLNYTRSRELSKITVNSALDRNISDKQENQSLRQQTYNASKNILPSSLLGQSIEADNQFGLQKYRTVMTHKNEQAHESLNDSLSSELKQLKRIAQLQKELQYIRKQQKLKMDLLAELKNNNSKKALKIKNKLRLKKIQG